MPTRLLPTPSNVLAPARCFSTSSWKAAEDKDNEDKSAPADLMSKFGFQSLTGLFGEPERPHGRYSRPKIAPKTAQSAEGNAEGSANRTSVSSTPPSVTVPVQDGVASTQNSVCAETRKSGGASMSKDSNASTPPARKTRRQRLTIRRVVDDSIVGEDRNGSPPQTTGKDWTGVPQFPVWRKPKRRENPFARIPASAQQKSVDPHAGSPQGGSWGSPAWGLDVRHNGDEGSWNGAENAAASATNSSTLTKHTLTSQRERRRGGRAKFEAAQAAGEAAATDVDTSGTFATERINNTESTVARSARADSRVLNIAGVAPSTLTHLTPSGEAHMVDVGAKPSTRRVAVAVAAVRFSNTESIRLIAENSNKKGDVLGVARIAGIMAAKRTSDLIPLCHPIPISKVSVDLELLGEGSFVYGPCGIINGSKTGTVFITAQVETVGPTGVEMEALTAVTGAALTVYDMCKAVDKMMEVRDVGVVYKSGGRSGLFVASAWAHSIGKEVMERRGLDWDAWRSAVSSRAKKGKGFGNSKTGK